MCQAQIIPLSSPFLAVALWQQHSPFLCSWAFSQKLKSLAVTLYLHTTYMKDYIPLTAITLLTESHVVTLLLF